MRGQPRGAVPPPAIEPAEAPAMNSTARWVLGALAAFALAAIPAIVTWGAMGARLDALEQDLAKVEMRVVDLPAHGSRLSSAEGRIIEHEDALKALRSDSARTAEAVAETNGILKVLLKD